MPLVSVIIPAYNQARFLAEAVDSVIAQTHADLEIIIVDDGSTDHTGAIARSFGDSRVRYFFQENRGLSAARNTGILNSFGQFLSFLDADDVFLPRKIELLLRELERHPDAGMAAGQAIPIDEVGVCVGRPFENPLPDDPVKLLLGNPLHVGAVLVRKSWQETVGLFDEELRSYEDWDMWIRLAFAGCKAVWVPKPVSLYRFHTAQMTRASSQMTASTFAVLDKFFSKPSLPERWFACKELAYSTAHLRAAAQAFRVRNYSDGSHHLCRAVEANPTLMQGGGRPLADHFRAWTDIPKIKEPLGFLEDLYAHLPSELSPLAERRRKHLGQAALDWAFDSFARGDFAEAKRYALRALLYRPSFLIDRGVLSTLGKSILHFQGKNWI